MIYRSGLKRFGLGFVGFAVGVTKFASGPSAVRNAVMLLLLLMSGSMGLPLAAQLGSSSSPDQDAALTGRLESHLKFGEFSRALDLVGQLESSALQDQWRRKIGQQQFAAGARGGSFATYRGIADDSLRAEGYHDNYQRQWDQVGQVDAWPGGENTGAAGGITAADFTELINLIQSTIQPDSWQDATGAGTIMAYPSGVFVDGSGLLKRIKPSRQVDWDQVRRDVLQAEGLEPGPHLAGLRKVSLTRLERQLHEQAAQGIEPTADQRHVGGLYEIQYLLVYPDQRDIVIAGPAGPWQLDDQGRARNIETGRPCLQLDDLVVCLRNACEADGVFGCSIDPTAENLKATQQFLQDTPLKGRAWREGLREVLGKQQVTVHGVDPLSRVARIIVEADYRMKLIGMGIEPGVTQVPSYLERLELGPAGQLPPMDLARWWFTLNYDAVRVSEDHLAFAFAGDCVKLASESEEMDDEGNRVHTGQASAENAQFARDFTEHFDALADQHVVFAELKNVFDLALVAALIRHENLNSNLGWELTYFGSEGDFTHQIRQGDLPREVDSVMNFRELESRQGSRRLKHTLVGVSGGVEFAARQVVSSERFEQDPGLVTVHHSNRREQPALLPQRDWYWD